jgi:hypothetical protein
VLFVLKYATPSTLVDASQRQKNNFGLPVDSRKNLVQRVELRQNSHAYQQFIVSSVKLHARVVVCEPMKDLHSKIVSS